MRRADDFGVSQVARARRVDAQFEADLRRAFGQHDHAVGELSGLFDIVRHQRHGTRALPQQSRQFLPHSKSGQIIERGKRFIQ